MAGFTPGPWQRIRDNHFRVEQDDTGYTSWIPLGPEGGLTVAMAVTDGDCDDDETDANARLIAAAPELYEALEALLKGCAIVAEKTGIDAEAECLAFVDSPFAKARRALVKASGEQVSA